MDAMQHSIIVEEHSSEATGLLNWNEAWCALLHGLVNAYGPVGRHLAAPTLQTCLIVEEEPQAAGTV